MSGRLAPEVVMEAINVCTDAPSQLEQAIQLLATALRAEPDLLGIVPLYVLAVGWMVHRWLKPDSQRYRTRFALGIAAGAGLLRLLSAVVVLALGLLFAVARTAGRSTFHAGGRF